MGRTGSELLILLILMLAMLIGCSEDPVALEKNIYNPDIQGTLKSDTLYATKDTTYLVNTKVNTGFSSRLLVGQYRGLKARPVFRFTNFDSVPDSAQIQGAKVRLTIRGIAGPTTSPSFPVSAFPVQNKWENNLDSINYDHTTSLGDTLVTASPTDSLLYIEMNNLGIEKVNFWSDTANPDENYGMILDFDPGMANFIRYFSSINSSDDPSLIVFYTLPDTSGTFSDTISATFDTYIYDGSLFFIPNSDLNYVSTLIAYNTLLQFDLEGFHQKYPEGTVINSANLQITVNRDSSLINPGFDVRNLEILKLTTQIDNQEVVADSTNGLFAGISQWIEDTLETKREEDRRRLAQNFIQAQLRNLESPHGMIISFIDVVDPNTKISNEKDFYSYLGFYSSENPVKQVRPRLILTFWVPPRPRF